MTSLSLANKGFKCYNFKKVGEKRPIFAFANAKDSIFLLITFEILKFPFLIAFK